MELNLSAFDLYWIYKINELKDISVIITFTFGAILISIGLALLLDVDGTFYDCVKRHKIFLYSFIIITAISSILVLLIPDSHTLCSMVILNNYPGIDSNTLEIYIKELYKVINLSE